jgi:excisionase family DNA binding protein
VRLPKTRGEIVPLNAEAASTEIESDPVAVAGQALQKAAEGLDLTVRALRVLGEMLEIEAEHRAQSKVTGRGLTVPQAAACSGIPEHTLYKAIRTGQLRAEKVGRRNHRIPENYLEAYRRSLLSGSPRRTA